MTNLHPKETPDFAPQKTNGVATGKVAMGKRPSRGRPTNEYRARVAAERRVLRAGDTKTLWVKYLRYLYAELLKAHFGHKYDPDVRERFGDLFLSTMEAYFAKEKRPLRRYLPALTYLLWQTHGLPSEAARLEWVFERIDWRLDAVFGESELARRILRLAAVVATDNTAPPTWLNDWDFHAYALKGGLPRKKPPITLTLNHLLTANYPPTDWLRFFAVEAGRPDLLFGLDDLTPVLKQPKPPIL
jgi:hypothetical protein